MFTSTRDAEELLRTASLRVTAQRSGVLHVLEQHPHVDVRSLKALVVNHIGSVSTQALYDVVGALEDVDCVGGEAPCLTPPTTKGFVVDEAELTFWGTCRSCSDTDDGAQTPSPTKENI